MTQSNPQTRHMPEQNKQEMKADAPRTDAEKKAKAEKARAQGGSSSRSQD
jgi:hypothetical protein